MNILSIKKLQHPISIAEQVSSTFNSKYINSNSITVANWNEFSYKPNVKFRIAHDNFRIYLNYQVKENEIRAELLKDNSDVYKDSCVEFFIRFKDEAFYYNIECNCLGVIKMAVGSNRQNRKLADTNILDSIKRNSSLKANSIKESSGYWELSLLIPKEVFFRSKIDSFSGMNAHGNFYKCGDDLEVPHYLSYFQIDTPQPDFHRPEDFGKLIFE